MIGGLAELQGTVFIKKSIGTVRIKQGLVCVHTGTIDSKNRLGHKGGMEAVLCRDGTDYPFECHRIVRRFQSVSIFEVNLMLAFGYLMMGSLDLKMH